MAMVLEYGDLLAAELRARRRRAGAASPEAFARIYLPHHVSKPASRMHRELFALLRGATGTRPRRLAVAAPRGHAKSTVASLAYPLWSVLYGKEPFVLLVSATTEQAYGLLRTVKTELQSNPLLLEDFPEACQPPGARGTPKPWRDNQIALRSGPYLRAASAGQSIRGLKHGRERPSLIVADDLEERETALSEEGRSKLWDWFTRTLLKVGHAGTNVVVVGTVLHHDSLLARLVGLPGAQRASGWEGSAYRAVEAWSARPELWERWEALYSERDEHEGATGPAAAETFYRLNREAMLEGTQVLWPEAEDYRALMEVRVREGRMAFGSEKQNEPVDPDECLFRPELFRYWCDEHRDASDLVRALGRRGRVVGACDPSLGRRGGKGDFCAIVTVLVDRDTDVFYVLDADLARRTPGETIERIVDLARVFRYDGFAVEANGFQEMLVEQLEGRAREEGVSLRVDAVTHTSDKKGRIQSLEPLVAQGRLRFARRQGLLLEQLQGFPLGAHDDGPDALHMAVEAARRDNRPRITVF